MVVYKEYYKSLGKNIKKFRKEKEWTQEQLAEYSNFSRIFIAKLERPDFSQSVALESIFRLAETLEVHPKDLFEFELSPLK